MGYIKKKLTTKKCEFCGDSFQTRRSKQKFCCKDCGRRFWAEEHKKTGHIKDYKPIDCITCGKNFKPRYKHHKYCSKKCSSRRGGLLGTARKREYFLEKFNLTCQECGLEPDNTSELHVHHIEPMYQGGADTEENLTVLCIDCHRKAHEIL